MCSIDSEKILPLENKRKYPKEHSVVDTGGYGKLTWTFGPGEGESHMKGEGMLVVSLKGVNFEFWSHLGCSG